MGELDEPGGYGLFLVGRLADRWGVETDDATRVWFVLRRD
jgi:anti-sigma regulatory factor (Ser/Thr protein kinase)